MPSSSAVSAPPIVSLGRAYPAHRCSSLLNRLLQDTEWQSDYVAFGRRIDIPRMQAWYADPGIHYRYASNQLHTRDWSPLLLDIRLHVEKLTGHHFNSVLLTCYRNGDDHVGWHADNETELGDQPVIASLSLGSRRHFHFRRNDGQDEGSIELHPGDLILMQPEFQQQWQHAVLAATDVQQARLNLTFRQVVVSRDR